MSKTTPPTNTNPTPAPSTAALEARLALAERRVLDLEGQLREASDVITSMRTKDSGLQMPFPLVDINRSCDLVAAVTSIRFPEGKYGAERRQKVHSAFEGLKAVGARTKEGLMVENQTRAFFWIIDQLSFVGAAP